MSLRVLCSLVTLLVCTSCGGGPPAEPVRTYELTGQVLGLLPDRQEVSVRHDDIAGYMPGMTMNFSVASPALLEGRTPGELIQATLEVDGLTSRLTRITRTGIAPLPENTNAAVIAGGILEPGDALPDVALIDQSDRRRSLSEWVGTPLLVTFIYTRCPLPNYCPLMDRHFTTIQKSLAADASLRGQLRLLSVSFDPDYDTPAVLATHATRLGADPAVWTMLTGDKVTIERLAARFGVGVIRGPSGTTEITHNLRTALFDARGTLVKVYQGSEWTPSGVLGDLRGVLAR